MADRQLATAVYLIDQFALRAGNEKGDDEADTVGCCSLKFEHVTLKPPNKVVFDFLGKDSIRFFDEVEVIDQVFKNLKIFKKSPKGPGDDIFDRVTTTQLNKHLGEYMPGLSAKVFRTYNASVTMADLLNKMKPKGTIHEKVKEYNDANRTVAILCNHKRTVTESHAGQMEKMEDKVCPVGACFALIASADPWCSAPTDQRPSVSKVAVEANDSRRRTQAEEEKGCRLV